MKKIKILMLLVLIVLLSACGSKKEVIDDEEFGRIMSNQGFKIVNVEDQFSQYGYFEDAYVALEKNGNYQIEFYELDEEENAINFYNTNKQVFESTKTNTSVYTNVDLNNTSKYTLVTDSEYKVLSRIEDTVVFVNVDKKYKNEVQDILKKLGY